MFFGRFLCPVCSSIQFLNSDAGDDERARLGIPIRQFYATTAAATSRQSARRTTGNVPNLYFEHMSY